MNSGKDFENQFKNSVPKYVYYHRISDSTGNFSGGNKLRFSSKQPFDAILWNGETRLLYALELKTTKNKMFSFEDINIEDKQPNKMIHKHQILGLLNVSEYKNVISGFILNFRDEKNCKETTYFLNIKNFIELSNSINKKSFNEKDLLLYNPIKIDGFKKRVKYEWNVDKFLKETAM